VNLNNIEKLIKDLENKVSSLKGQLSLLEDQFVDTNNILDELKESRIINDKSIELLNLVQKATKELIQNMLEGIITKALCFVYQNDGYKFELEFSRHGTSPKLKFLLKTPDMQESHDILTTRAGGEKDIITLALRLVLLEISKNKGILFLDEAFKRLDSDETVKLALEFIYETQKETHRQILMIGHEKERIITDEPPMINDKPKKKRGRPKKG